MTDTNEDLPNISELAARRLCSNCIGEPYLRAQIEQSDEEGECDYCGNSGSVVSIDELSDEIDAAFERHYVVTSSEPSPLEYTMMNEGDYVWEREGDPATYVIGEAAKIDEGPAEDIRQVLAYRHWDIELAKMGEESPFNEDTYYAERDIDDIELRENWRYFEESLKTEARFFSTSAQATLDDIFEGIHKHKQDDGSPIIVEAGLGTSLTGIFRARVFQSDERLEEALKHPNKELGPPPPTQAMAGRMNARGISVFYGAISADVAVGEVRPPVGSRVASARFEFLRKVRLLDIVALRSVYVEGSIFDLGYLERLELVKFLGRLSDRFARPVMPDDEPLDYLPTQAIADYLAAGSDPALDGILYPSVQSDEKAANVVLFHKSSRVAAIDLPNGTEINASTGFDTEEGWEEQYWVWENVPPIESETHNSQPDESPFGVFPISPTYFDLDRDRREPVLQIVLPSMQIHSVRAAKYSSTVRNVQRHRSTKSFDEF